MSTSTKILLVGLFLGGCTGATAPALVDPDRVTMARAHQYNLTLETLPAELWWYRNAWIRDTTAMRRDSAGVLLFALDGQDYYHPVLMAQTALRWLDNARTTGVARYRELAEAHATRLIQEAVWFDGVPYFPYRFDWALHGIAEEPMQAPWFSGMAQGQALSLFVRLYETTENTVYATLADLTLRSLIPHDGHPAVARIDTAGFYWVVEYPFTAPPFDTQALNGMLFALMGVYEATQILDHALAMAVFEAGMATVAAHARTYRVPGDLSLYCLRHERQFVLYHRIHITQLETLGTVSGLPDVTALGQLLAGDACPDGPPCGLAIR